ncbi:MAG: class I SAM-dependent methyltransferase [Alphaproteobacteria bacterium]|nr:class I SAM-dependent methyltransferase [Alphaproteobacteria bacterium]
MAKQSYPIVSGVTRHPMMALPTHDDHSRQLFAQSFMNEMNGSYGAGNKVLWDRKVRSQYVREHRREPEHVGDVRRALLREPYTQYWSSLKRCAREMSYESVGPMVERQLPTLIDRARAYRTSNRRLGSLALDPNLRAPRYVSAVHYHAKPGGYLSELTEDDVFAGAEYDCTYFLTGTRPALVGGKAEAEKTAARQRWGAYGPLGDGYAAAVGAWAEVEFPSFRPRRILDLGCTIGHNTLPWVDLYPRAEVYAIDVSAPCLRYAHARAEALGRRVHFFQETAERTTFSDGYFDLVVSTMLLHELTVSVIHRIFAECFRLLAPNGLMLHADMGPAKDMDMLSQIFQLDWNTHFNAEPFITKLSELDLSDVAAKGGFATDDTFRGYAPSTQPGSSAKYHFFGARRR